MKISGRHLITYTLSFIMIGISVWLVSPWKSLEAQDDKYRKTLSAKGINFDLPEDWPIEDRGGSVGPIPIEEYVTIRFRKVEQKFADAAAEVSSVEQNSNDAMKRLEELEKTVSDMDTRLKDLEQWLKYGNARQL